MFAPGNYPPSPAAAFHRFGSLAIEQVHLGERVPRPLPPSSIAFEAFDVVFVSALYRHGLQSALDRVALAPPAPSVPSERLISTSLSA